MWAVETLQLAAGRQGHPYTAAGVPRRRNSDCYLFESKEGGRLGGHLMGLGEQGVTAQDEHLLGGEVLAPLSDLLHVNTPSAVAPKSQRSAVVGLLGEHPVPLARNTPGFGP